MRNVTLFIALAVGVLLVACGAPADHPAADRTKSVEQVQQGAKSLSESELKAAIESYEAEIEAEQDPEAARKLKDRLKPYQDELTRRRQR